MSFRSWAAPKGASSSGFCKFATIDEILTLIGLATTERLLRNNVYEACISLLIFLGGFSHPHGRSVLIASLIQNAMELHSTKDTKAQPSLLVEQYHCEDATIEHISLKSHQTHSTWAQNQNASKYNCSP